MSYLTNPEEERHKLLQKFVLEYRHGDRTFRTPRLSVEVKLMRELLDVMHRYEVVDEIREEHVRNPLRFNLSLEFMAKLDEANAWGLIQPSEDKLRELERYRQQGIALQSTINQLRNDLKTCQDDFKAYSDRIQPLRHGKTENSDVDAAPTS